MPSVGFEPTISAGERPQTHVLDRPAIGTGTANFTVVVVIVIIIIVIIIIIIIIIIIVDFIAFIIPNMSHIQQTNSVTSTMTCGNGVKHAPFLGFSL